MSSTSRRFFLKSTVATGATLATTASVASKTASASANDTLVVGVMGVNGRGSSLARGFAQQDNCEVSAVCDVDSRAIAKGQAAVEGLQKRVPKAFGDIRKMLEDKSLDILVVAAPNHWHAPATILGCNHNKHVYVEKPCSHTPWEGEMAVKAARHHDRVVTMGSQRRSREILQEGIQRIHDGEVGDILYSRCWYSNRRGSIGKGKNVDLPEWLDYELWQGPCTEQPFKDNLVHYNWHWHWHWGNGELGNNGVHALDVARWGMQVDYPTRVVSGGGRYRFDDDQETADTHLVSFEFGDRMMMWEGLSWSPHGLYESGFGVTFHGTNGMLHMFDTGFRIYDMQRKVVDEVTGSGGDAEHFNDFLGCIREGGRPTADIEEGHKSTLLCHLGNIAQQTGRSLDTDPTNGHIVDDAEASKLWTKDYREGWTPTIS